MAFGIGILIGAAGYYFAPVIWEKFTAYLAKHH